MNGRLNHVFAEFSHCDRETLSTLFRIYCMNIIWMPSVRYNYTYLHNNLVHLINISCLIKTVLEKKSNTFAWTLINRQKQLYNQISSIHCIIVPP